MAVFGKQFEVDKMPIDFNIGVITGIENLRDSGKNPLNQVIDIKVNPILAGRKRKDGETFYLVIRESWFQPGTSKNDIEKGAERFLFDRFFGRKGQMGILNTLFTEEQIEELGVKAKSSGVPLTEFVDLLKEHCVNTVRGYTLEQGSDSEEVVDPDTGKTKKVRFRTEFKGVGKFFGPEDVESIQKSLVKSVDRAADESAKVGADVAPSMRVHWEISDEVNPFQTVIDQLNAA